MTNTTTTRKASATTTETTYGAERTYTATRIDSGTTRRNATYAIAVDGVVVGIALYRGGRRYWVTEADGSKGWEFITPDGGKVVDVMDYVARCAVHEMQAR